MNDPTHIKELRKEIESLCGNCDRPDKEQLGEIILSSMALGFSYGMESRPSGEWIDCGSYYKCPFCEEIEFESDGKTNFCPNCGARMREINNE